MEYFWDPKYRDFRFLSIIIILFWLYSFIYFNYAYFFDYTVHHNSSYDECLRGHNLRADSPGRLCRFSILFNFWINFTILIMSSSFSIKYETKKNKRITVKSTTCLSKRIEERHCWKSDFPPSILSPRQTLRTHFCCKFDAYLSEKSVLESLKTKEKFFDWDWAESIKITAANKPQIKERAPHIERFFVEKN